MKILLVDDDATLIELLSRSLAEKGYGVDAVIDGETWLDLWYYLYLRSDYYRLVFTETRWN